MRTLLLAGFFSVGGGGYYLLILVFMVLLVGLYIWGSSRKRKDETGGATEEYAYLTEETLAALPDDKLVKAVAANLIAKLDDRHPDAYAVIPQLSRGRCVVYSVWLICHELDEAGFEELFGSPSGEFTELAVGAMEELGAPRCVEALRKSMAAGPEELSDLHADFLEAVEEEKPLELCAAYIRDNPSEFIDPPDDDPNQFKTITL